MPIAGRTSSRGVTVRGGRKLARFLRRADDPNITETARAIAVARVMRRVLIPMLRQALPKRTGALRRSLRVEQRGVHIAIRINFYWRFLRIGPMKERPDEYAIRLVEQNRALFVREIGREVLKALLA